MRIFGVTQNAGIAFRVGSSYKDCLNPTCVLSKWAKMQILHLGQGFFKVTLHLHFMFRARSSLKGTQTIQMGFFFTCGYCIQACFSFKLAIPELILTYTNWNVGVSLQYLHSYLFLPTEQLLTFFIHCNTRISIHGIRWVFITFVVIPAYSSHNSHWFFLASLAILAYKSHNSCWFIFDLNKLCIAFRVGFSHKVCFLPLCDNSNLIFSISLKKIQNEIVLFHICLNPKISPQFNIKYF